MWTDRQADATKLIVAFRNFGKAPNNVFKSSPQWKVRLLFSNNQSGRSQMHKIQLPRQWQICVTGLDIRSWVFKTRHFSHSRRTEVTMCTAYFNVNGQYSDTSANEDNSFRNHIRQPKSSLAETSRCLERKQPSRVGVSRLCDVVSSFLCHTHTDGKDKLLEWPDRSCLLLYVSACIH